MLLLDFYETGFVVPFISLDIGNTDQQADHGENENSGIANEAHEAGKPGTIQHANKPRDTSGPMQQKADEKEDKMRQACTISISVKGV